MDTPLIPGAQASALFASTPSNPTPKNAAESAKQFEALLIAQMLRTAREASEDEGGDSTGETMLDVAGQQFAQMLADRGGFGLAKVIERGLD
jgi:Rod binding domain-containing protein